MPFPKLVANATDTEAQQASDGRSRRDLLHRLPDLSANPTCLVHKQTDAQARAAADSIECEVEDGGNVEDLLAELLNSIEFGHDQDQSIEEIIAGIRRDLDQGILF